MEERGLSVEEVLRELEERLKLDMDYRSGRILGSMCTRPHPLARRVYAKYLEKNLGDPGLFKGTAEVEREVVAMLASLMSKPDAVGMVVSGGSEANILALWSARDRMGRRKVVAPESAHASMDKAASMLGLELVKAPVNEEGEVDVEAVRRMVDDRTAAIVGIAGTTDLGAIDPIPELSEVAVERGVHLHVDAAFGGLVIPFLRDLGYQVREFDFKLPGVCSITVDPHKMGMAPIPAGGLLFRDESMLRPLAFTLPYLSGGPATQFTITGTRPGASAIAVWALFKYLGREGYRRVVARCMELTIELARGVERVPRARLVRWPTMNVVGIAFDGLSAERVASRLRELGWAVSAVRGFLRVVVMPHVRRSHIERFLRDLRRVVAG